MADGLVGWVMEMTAWVAPFFIVMSPILSYADQIVSMYRAKTSAGFSLDIPLIMLVASFLRIFYWPQAQYDTSLLLQSLLMVIVQVALLKVALDFRPPPPTKGGDAGLPFAGADDSLMGFQRPYNFWQWRSPRRYWQAIMYFAAALVVLELLLSQMPGLYAVYANAIGCIGLGVEATLPIPQILINARTKSSKGLRLSVLAAWIGGDTMKLFWFFTSKSEIPWSFKISGMFQASCDFFLGFQYLIYNTNTAEESQIKEHPMVEWEAPKATTRSHSRSLTPTRRPAPFVVAQEVK
ncbi:hypothetical protein HYE67_007148 [Fusarium culmorum]|uniref:PQ-loop repeat-containing protein 1 n=1 Tax=Fusarium culmorum TaxID=5516 RepID=A0A2T4H1K3_FUSCU|nr:PQ-loop repeat-containing protein 1 [Fusarium culmorum]QPC64917.1 hypothetical protein HYE67_007148 [Fusarium culmorum]